MAGYLLYYNGFISKQIINHLILGILYIIVNFGARFKIQ